MPVFLAAAVVIGSLTIPVLLQVLDRAVDQDEARSVDHTVLLSHPDIERLDADLDFWYG